MNNDNQITPEEFKELRKLMITVKSVAYNDREGFRYIGPDGAIEKIGTDSINALACFAMKASLDKRDIGYSISSGCNEKSIAYEHGEGLKVLQGFATEFQALLALCKVVKS